MCIFKKFFKPITFFVPSQFCLVSSLLSLLLGHTMSEVVAMRCLYHSEIETVSRSCFRNAPESLGGVGVGLPQSFYSAKVNKQVPVFKLLVLLHVEDVTTSILLLH